MSVRKAKRPARKAANLDAPLIPLDIQAHINRQRVALFGASAIIAVCATAAPDETMDADELACALRVAGKIVDNAAATLEDYCTDDESAELARVTAGGDV
jgi:hypothetical protein